MGGSKHTEAQIIAVLKQAEARRTVDDVARECGVGQATIYTWKSKFDGMEVSEAQRLRSLEDEKYPSEHHISNPKSRCVALTATARASTASCGMSFWTEKSFTR